MKPYLISLGAGLLVGVIYSGSPSGHKDAACSANSSDLGICHGLRLCGRGVHILGNVVFCGAASDRSFDALLQSESDASS